MLSYTKFLILLLNYSYIKVDIFICEIFLINSQMRKSKSPDNMRTVNKRMKLRSDAMREKNPPFIHVLIDGDFELFLMRPFLGFNKENSISEKYTIYIDKITIIIYDALYDKTERYEYDIRRDERDNSPRSQIERKKIITMLSNTTKDILGEEIDYNFDTRDWSLGQLNFDEAMDEIEDKLKNTITTFYSQDPEIVACLILRQGHCI